MNDRSKLPPERRRPPLDNHRQYCQVTSAFPTAKPVKLLMGDPLTKSDYSTIVVNISGDYEPVCNGIQILNTGE
jgi:hypothetical protein